MRLDELPDLVLHEICLNLDAKNISSLQRTSQRLFDDMIKSFNPHELISHDHEQLANMSPLWWQQITKYLRIYDIIDHRRYLPHFDRCADIFLTIDYPVNLTEILDAMTKKNLKRFSITGYGEITCTDDDFRKIGLLSNEMESLELTNISESSDISNDVILDMIENGSFSKSAFLFIDPQIRQSFKYFWRKTKQFQDSSHWLDEQHLVLEKPDGSKFFITF